MITDEHRKLWEKQIAAEAEAKRQLLQAYREAGESHEQGKEAERLGRLGARVSMPALQKLARGDVPENLTAAELTGATWGLWALVSALLTKGELERLARGEMSPTEFLKGC